MRATSTRVPEQPLQGGHPTVRHAVEMLMLEERTKWAMQIHDGLTQSVTSAVLELQTLRARIDTDPEGAAAALAQVEREIRDDLRKIRELLFEMTREDPPPAEPALAALVRDLGIRWHFPVSVEVDGELEASSEKVLEAIYAIVSEALANAAKHSGAPAARVRVTATDAEVRVEIEDRGRGIAAVKDEDPHFGVGIMRTRAEALAGTLDVESTPGRGTTVVAVLPVGRAGG